MLPFYYKKYLTGAFGARFAFETDTGPFIILGLPASYVGAEDTIYNPKVSSSFFNLYAESAIVAHCRLIITSISIVILAR